MDSNREKRTCHTCRLFIENEIHFVLYCPVYDQYRLQHNEIFNSECYMKENPILEIVNPQNIRIARKICNFLNECFNKRKEKLQNINV